MRKEIRGYDPAAVDAFLARCLATVGVHRLTFPQLRGVIPGGEPVTPEEIAAVRFPSTLLGYPIREVDDLLDELQAAVAVTTWPAPTRRDAAAAEARRPAPGEAEPA